MSSNPNHRRHQGVHGQCMHVPSKNSNMPDLHVTDNGILAEYIRRPKLWTLPLIIVTSSTRMIELDGSDLPDAPLMGCIHFPYDLQAFEFFPNMRQRVSVVLFTDDTTLPGLDLLHKIGGTSAQSIMWLAQFYEDARKITYLTPEDAVSDGWYMS